MAANRNKKNVRTDGMIDKKDIYFILFLFFFMLSMIRDPCFSVGYKSSENNNIRVIPSYLFKLLWKKKRK